MIPPELLPFVATPGRVLLIKGSAGAGKTLLAMELARAYQAKGGDVLWVSSRQADPAESVDLEELNPTQHIESGRAAEAKPRQPSAMPPPPENDLLADVERDLDQADSLVIVDSIDGLVEEGAVGAANQFMVRAKATAMRSGARFAVTLESAGPHAIDHLADGVISLEQNLLDGARIRTLTLQKMRGTQVAHPMYGFTLANGTFGILQDEPREGPLTPLRAMGRPGKDGFLPTGINGWDTLLSGGFRQGTVHLVEFTANAAADLGRLTTPLVLNTLALGKSVLWAAMPNAARNRSRPPALEHLDQGANERLAFVEGSDLANGNGVDERLAPLLRNRRELQPAVSILSLDGLTVRGDDGRAWLSRWCQQTRATDSIDLLLAKADDQDFAILADDQWRVTRLHDVPLMRGIAPRTEHYFLRSRGHKGYPETMLEALQ